MSLQIQKTRTYLRFTSYSFSLRGFSFFQNGYDDGHAHGRIHGLIEGRAVGRDKGLELWEEVGYYRGFVSFWNAVYDLKQKQKKREDSLASLESYVSIRFCSITALDRFYRRAENHIKFLLGAIARFPLVNPNSLLVTDATHTDTPEVDITKLLVQIRSRHKALCAILGVKPRLRAIATGEQSIDGAETSTVTSGKVWALEKPSGKPLIY